MKNRKLVFALFFSIVGFLLVCLAVISPDVLSRESNLIRLVSLVLVLLWVPGFLLSRFNSGHAFRDAVAWIGMGCIGLVGYGYRDQLRATLFPSSSIRMGEERLGEARFSLSDNGHFLVDAEVGNSRVRFLVDSGATKVTLGKNTAVRLGITLKNLVFDQPSITANGIVMSASVVLEKIRIGTITLYNIPAAISSNDLDEPLLGMSFLGRLKSWRVEGDTLIFQR